MVKWITFLVAALGLSVGIYTVATNSPKVERPAPARAPSVNPFERGIAAAGIVEARSRNIGVAPPDAGLVTDVFVEVTQKIEKNQPLFKLDSRPLESELVRAEAVRRSAAVNVQKLRALPRPEDLPPLRAAVDQARSRLDDANDQLQRVNEASRRDAASPDEQVRKRFVVRAIEASLAAAQAELDRAIAGAWSQDIEVAEAALAQADAEIQAIKIRLDRMTVRSPITGVVLKRNIEPGMFAHTTGAGAAAIVVGDLSRLHVRTQVDEEDVGLLLPGAHAVARLRGAVSSTLPLKMLRIEPLASRKMEMTGDETERVDTRVIEVLLEIDGPSLEGVYPGQMVDVYIETARTAPEGAPTQPKQ